MLRIARDLALEQMERHGPVAAWVVDDTSIPKKGRHSVGVARQYCGVLGKQENCQVAVTVTLANDAVSVAVAYQLYLPEAWSRDAKRRRAAGVPIDIPFRTKWQIALEQITWLREEGLPPAPVVADAGYGVITEFRDQLTAMEVPYVVGVTGETVCGRRARSRGDPNDREAGDGRRHDCGAVPTIVLSVSTSSPRRCHLRPGRRSPGGKARGARCDLASSGCASGPRIAMNADRSRVPRNGS